MNVLSQIIINILKRLIKKLYIHFVFLKEYVFNIQKIKKYVFKYKK